MREGGKQETIEEINRNRRTDKQQANDKKPQGDRGKEYVLEDEST